MTIRLRCAECRRKLKVVDEALGKKVQCPACGARFIGKIESSSPPAVKSQADTPLAAVPLAMPVSPPPPETPADDDIFSELSAFSTPSAKEIPPVKVMAQAKPDGALFPNLELDQSPAEVRDAEVEAVEPEVIDEGVEPLPVEDETALEEIEEIVDHAEAVEDTDTVDVAEEGIEPEIVDEDESAEETKRKPKKKKSRGTLYVWLAIAFMLLLGCAGGGYAVYLYVNGQL